MTWDVEKVRRIVEDSTTVYRKGEALERRGNVVELNAYPHEDEADEAGAALVDMHFVTVAVDQAEAIERGEALGHELDRYPDRDRFAGGPSYIEVGAELGDQELALRLFAMGKVLGLWDVITPATLGIEGEAAREAAGRGFVLMTGYNKDGG